VTLILNPPDVPNVTAMTAPHSKHAAYKGYTMFIEDFKIFFSTLKPSFMGEILPNHLTAYDSWRRSLTMDDRTKVPKLRRGSNLSFHSISFETTFLFLAIPFPGEERTGIPSEDRIEKVFFPVRHEEYAGEEEAQFIFQESAADRAFLEEFASFVRSQGGTLDLTLVAGFGCLYPDLNKLNDVCIFITCLFHLPLNYLFSFHLRLLLPLLVTHLPSSNFTSKIHSLQSIHSISS
jgi:hypothetical protein